jgi:XTP/dITP diphosphohydrolase
MTAHENDLKAGTLRRKLLIATGNAGKLREIRALLNDALRAAQIELLSLRDFDSIQEVAENGSSFAENATLKARGYAAQTDLWTLADDSGLEVEALGGAPGVFSARYGGAGLDDAVRRAVLLDALRGVALENRRARFVCVIAIFDPRAERLELAQGVCEGHIALAARGTRGFGYDPVFIPDGYAQTFGELPDAVKQRISHRARAIHEARRFLIKT